MNYRVRHLGEDLGIFPLEELRRRREAGELTGGEYVQGEGMADWQPLDLVLQHGRQVTPPPLPPSVSKGALSQTVVWVAAAGGLIVFILIAGVVGIFVNRVQRGFVSAMNQPQAGLNQTHPKAVAAASKPILWTAHTLTAADAQKRDREFRIRQWLESYKQYGQRNPECDAEAVRFIRAYIAVNYGGPGATNKSALEAESGELVGDSNCTDPAVLTVAADESLNVFDAMHCLERARAEYPISLYKAYPRFYANVRLEGLLGVNSDRIGALETSALELLSKCFDDGSITPADQQEIADIFVNGWGYNFFQRNAASICAIVHKAGLDYNWLALTLDGEREIEEAWAARGGGYSDTVTDAGWRSFKNHLALARKDLTQAWRLQPGWPVAPERMIYVSLGDSGIQEMRRWFDRTTAAQIDYPRAWSDFRWGLRPRWYGNEKAMLALGEAAINTGRFDTDVPRKYMDCIADVESEMGLPVGQHIYGRADIWPNLKRIYDGYVGAPVQAKYRDGWRTSYAVVAYFAGKYDIARRQLKALNWKPMPEGLRDWGVDLSLMPLEVAARTGPLGREISGAESARKAGNIAGAMETYSKLNDAPAGDARTRKFIQYRLAELSAGRRLQKGEWIGLLPASDHDANWVFSFGKTKVLPDGSLEVEYGRGGDMLDRRLRVGANFEVRGEFEVVRSSNKNFQAGIVMGLPDFNTYNWYGFRIKRHDVEGDVVCLGVGWSTEQIVQHVVLNDVTNSFDFILKDGKVTATVNGVEVFHQAQLPGYIRVANNDYHVGLGAFSDSADAVICYRDVRLRKL
ncbi:MAG: hypothetical protein KGR98_04940 [Verrucomicrobia bacterium]|nr:hypothetical protein [Verrucomicrobiota bacterium]MDE3099192.1 DUF4339 domain-containing protein [Verrucomicrobiota bacterium]